MSPQSAPGDPPGSGRDAIRTSPLSDPFLLAGVAFLAILCFAWAVHTYDREHDPHMVVARVREIEAQIRARSPRVWLLVEGKDAPDRNDPPEEVRHQAILRDFERLANLDGFEMTDVHAEVTGDSARVSYRVHGVARAGREPVPSAGEMVFTRDAGGWRLFEHRLFEKR